MSGYSHTAYHDAPEVFPHSAPQYIGDEPAQKIVIPNAPSPPIPAPGHIQKDAQGGAQPPNKPWWKRKAIIIPIAAAILIGIGLAIGLGVSLDTRKKAPRISDGNSWTDDNNDDNSNGGGSNGHNDQTNGTKVSCKDGLCPRIISLTEHQTVLYAFARTMENKIAMRALNDTAWDIEFTDFGSGGGGTLISQPSSHSWSIHDKYPRLDVWTVSNRDHTSWQKHYSDAEGWTDWETQGPNVGSSIIICGSFAGEMDVWSIYWDSSNICHTWWHQKLDVEISKDGLDKGITSEHGWMHADKNQWKNEDSLGTTNTAPAMLCRDNNGDRFSEAIWYDSNNDRVLHKNYAKGAWSSAQAFGGKFIGEPSIYGFKDKEFDFFGVQEDKKLYHFSHKLDSGGYSFLNSLGGSLASSPAAVSIGNDRFDVVVLGTNGNLHHLHYDGSSWAEKWEDLGIGTHSAPTVALYKNQVIIVAVTEKGSLIAVSRKAEVADTWRDSLKKTELGGDLSLEYYTSDL